MCIHEGNRSLKDANCFPDFINDEIGIGVSKFSGRLDEHDCLDEIIIEIEIPS